MAWKIGERDHPIFKALTKLNEGNRTCEADSLDAWVSRKHTILEFQAETILTPCVVNGLKSFFYRNATIPGLALSNHNICEISHEKLWEK